MGKNILQGIDTVIIRVSNIEDAKSWYIEKLGLSHVYENAELKLVVLGTAGPTSLTIWETEQKIQVNPRTSSYPIFTTLDAKEAHVELKQRSVTVEELITDQGVTYFTFRDPDNNVLEVCQVHQ